MCFSTPAVLAALVSYVLSAPLVARARDALGVRPREPCVRAFALVHNLGLAAFSAIVAYNTLPPLVSRVATDGLAGAMCAPFEPYWQRVFYVSKFYEFVDTWLIVLAHRQPSFLQTFHHVGVVVVMHAGLLAQATPMCICTALNATVHTVMYVYYALATVGIKSRYARYLTQMQIAQFLVASGGSLVVYATDAGVCCDPRVRVAVATGHAYLACLVVLFARFYRTRYLKRAPPRELI
jgi:hypothetical protein